MAVVASLSALGEDEMVTILTEPRNAIVRQYKALLAMEGVQLTFSPGALRELARRAISKGTGARALRLMIEEIMLDVMYEVPSQSGLASCTITEDAVRGNGEPVMEYVQKGRKRA